eukprot:m.1451375 g.1451375  ORF g.1451375 m.1451375 type:complete len:88 (+) comp25116_c0_seq23:140-403(+)
MADDAEEPRARSNRRQITPEQSVARLVSRWQGDRQEKIGGKSQKRVDGTRKAANRLTTVFDHLTADEVVHRVYLQRWAPVVPVLIQS